MEKGEKTFICLDCEKRKSYHAVRCRDCHYTWARKNPNLNYTKVDITDEFRNKLKARVAEIAKEMNINWT